MNGGNKGNDERRYTPGNRMGTKGTSRPVKRDADKPGAASQASNDSNSQVKTYKSVSRAATNIGTGDMRRTLSKGSIDIPLLLIFISLLVFGVIMVFSASYAYSYSESENSYVFIKNQLMAVALGGAVAFVIVLFYDLLMNHRWITPIVFAYFGAMILLLVAVLFIGSSEGEAKRWIYIGSLSIQPSEFMKGAMILFFAWYYARYGKKLEKSGRGTNVFMGTVFPLLLSAPILVLVLLENHISGTLILGIIAVMLIFMGERRHWLLLSLCVVGVVAIVLVVNYLLSFDPNPPEGAPKNPELVQSILDKYGWKRIDMWLRPERYDPQDGLWQTLQGLYAVGSGGFLGVGFGQSRQKHLFVSQPQNDFIYSIICEELGFVGGIAVIALFIALLWRGYIVGKRIPDRFSRMVVWGMTMSMTLQAFLNIAVVTNLLPNTGISLPFFSYGGSSLLSLMIEVGIVLALSRYAYKEA